MSHAFSFLPSGTTTPTSFSTTETETENSSCVTVWWATVCSKRSQHTLELNHCCFLCESNLRWLSSCSSCGAASTASTERKTEGWVCCMSSISDFTSLFMKTFRLDSQRMTDMEIHTNPKHILINCVPLMLRGSWGTTRQLLLTKPTRCEYNTLNWPAAAETVRTPLSKTESSRRAFMVKMIRTSGGSQRQSKQLKSWITWNETERASRGLTCQVNVRWCSVEWCSDGEEAVLLFIYTQLKHR